MNWTEVGGDKHAENTSEKIENGGSIE